MSNSLPNPYSVVGDTRDKSSSPNKLKAPASPAKKVRKKSSADHPAHSSSSSSTVINSSFYYRPVPHLPCADVQPSPSCRMYWSKTPVHGQMPGRNIRAHTSTLVSDTDGYSGKMYVIGGCDAKNCWKEVWVLDCDTFLWTKARPSGDPPPPMRAHSATLADDKIWIFGGGSGSEYYNSLYTFDTITHTWSKPECEGKTPSERRAHSSTVWNDKIVIFGGGDGVRAINDTQILHLPSLQNPKAKPRWEELKTNGKPPLRRGYHSANLIGDKLIIIGGSDGKACFGDIHVLDLLTSTWKEISVDNAYTRLSHTSTQIGSYLFIFGGHDGKAYSNQVLLFNLINLEWEVREAGGEPPEPRGYHTAVLYDSRVLVLGGFDGKKVFDNLMTLDLAGASYLPQITEFPFDC